MNYSIGNLSFLFIFVHFVVVRLFTKKKSLVHNSYVGKMGWFWITHKYRANWWIVRVSLRSRPKRSKTTKIKRITESFEKKIQSSHSEPLAQRYDCSVHTPLLFHGQNLNKKKKGFDGLYFHMLHCITGLLSPPPQALHFPQTSQPPSFHPSSDFFPGDRRESSRP
jgi:hypothetical protein